MLGECARADVSITACYFGDMSISFQKKLAISAHFK